MSQSIKPLDPIANPSGTIVTNGININEQILLFNDSLAELKLVFLDQSTDILPPCWARTYTKSHVKMGDIQYSTDFVLALAKSDVSRLYGILYETDEHIAEVNCSIARLTSIGNSGGIPVTTTQVINDNYSGTQNVVEATYIGDGVSSVVLNNIGLLQLGNVHRVGVVDLAEGQVQSNTIPILSMAGNTDLIINVPNVGGNHKLYIQVGGVNVFSIDHNGNVRALGSITPNVAP